MASFFRPPVNPLKQEPPGLAATDSAFLEVETIPWQEPTKDDKWSVIATQLLGDKLLTTVYTGADNSMQVQMSEKGFQRADLWNSATMRDDVTITYHPTRPIFVFVEPSSLKWGWNSNFGNALYGCFDMESHKVLSGTFYRSAKPRTLCWINKTSVIIAICESDNSCEFAVVNVVDDEPAFKTQVRAPDETCIFKSLGSSDGQWLFYSFSQVPCSSADKVAIVSLLGDVKHVMDIPVAWCSWSSTVGGQVQTSLVWVSAFSELSRKLHVAIPQLIGDKVVLTDERETLIPLPIGTSQFITGLEISEKLGLILHIVGYTSVQIFDITTANLIHSSTLKNLSYLEIASTSPCGSFLLHVNGVKYYKLKVREAAITRHRAAQREKERRETEERERQQRQKEAKEARLRREEEERRRREDTSRLAIITAWRVYEDRWAFLKRTGVPSPNSLGFNSVPWPVFPAPTSPEGLTRDGISNFLLSEHHSTEKTNPKRLRDAFLLWHPDRFALKVMPGVRMLERAEVSEGADVVARALSSLMEVWG